MTRGSGDGGGPAAQGFRRVSGPMSTDGMRRNAIGSAAFDIIASGEGPIFFHFGAGALLASPSFPHDLQRTRSGVWAEKTPVVAPQEHRAW